MKIKSIYNQSKKVHSKKQLLSVFIIFHFVKLAIPKILETKAGSPKYLVASLGALINSFMRINRLSVINIYFFPFIKAMHIKCRKEKRGKQIIRCSAIQSIPLLIM